MIFPQKCNTKSDKRNPGTGKSKPCTGLRHDRAKTGQHGALFGQIGSVDGQKPAFLNGRKPVPAGSEQLCAGNRRCPPVRRPLRRHHLFQNCGAEGWFRDTLSHRFSAYLTGRQIPRKTVQHHDNATGQKQKFRNGQVSETKQPEQRQADGKKGDAGADKRQTCSAFGQDGPVLGQHYPLPRKPGAQFGQCRPAGGRRKTGIDILVIFDDSNNIGRQRNQQMQAIDTERFPNSFQNIRITRSADSHRHGAISIKQRKPEILFETLQGNFRQQLTRRQESFVIFDKRNSVILRQALQCFMPGNTALRQESFSIAIRFFEFGYQFKMLHF